MLQRCLLGYLSERSGQAFSLEELRNDENLVAHLKRKVRNDKLITEAILNETTSDSAALV